MKIVTALIALFKLLSVFFNPEEQERRRKEKLLEKMIELEQAYAEALTLGDPEKAAMLDDEMRALRDRIRLLEGGS